MNLGTPRLCISAHPCTTCSPDGGQPHCRPMKGEHLDGCAGPDGGCKGCMPRLALPGIAVCGHCRTSVAGPLAQIAELYEDLLTPTKSSRSSQRAPGSERPEVLAGTALDARTSIEQFLIRWSVYLDDQIGAFPWGQQVSPGRWIIAPPWASARWLAASWAPARTVATMAARVARYIDWLLADPEQADKLVHDTVTIAAEARRRAYPAQPQGQYIGVCPIGGPDGEPCGGVVRATVDTSARTGWARCGTCKTEALIERWEALLPTAETRPWMGMKALRWHLALHHHRQLTERTIYNWARLADRDGGPEPQLRYVCDLTTRRQLFNVAEAAELCQLERRRGRPRIGQAVATAAAAVIAAHALTRTSLQLQA